MSDGGQDEEDPVPMGAAFEALRQPGIHISDAVNVDPDRLPPPAFVRRPPVEPPRPGVPTMNLLGDPADLYPDGQPAQEVRPGMKTLQVQSTGDDEIDAMLMLRAVFDGVDRAMHRRLLGYLADRYIP